MGWLNCGTKSLNKSVIIIPCSYLDGKTHNWPSAFLHSGVYMGSGEQNAWGGEGRDSPKSNSAGGVGEGVLVMLPIASCWQTLLLEYSHPMRTTTPTGWVTSVKPETNIFMMLFADFFYPEAVPDPQLLYYVFCVSTALNNTWFIATSGVSVTFYNVAMLAEVA